MKTALETLAEKIGAELPYDADRAAIVAMVALEASVLDESTRAALVELIAAQRPTLATIENMREAESRGKRCIAYSPRTFEEFSATSGDYYDRPEGMPLRDAEGDPLILAVKVTRYIDALTGKDLIA